MHGIVMVQFEAFVEKTFDANALAEVRARANLADQLYLPISIYADEEILSLLEAAVELTGKTGSDLLEAFGHHLVAPLIETYGNARMKSWDSLELLENVETTIHRVVRAREPSATPPSLQADRISEDTVEIRYESARGLCALARGLMSGVADYYGEEIEINESECMHAGADACVISASKRG